MKAGEEQEECVNFIPNIPLRLALIVSMRSLSDTARLAEQDLKKVKPATANVPGADNIPAGAVPTVITIPVPVEVLVRYAGRTPVRDAPTAEAIIAMVAAWMAEEPTPSIIVPTANAAVIPAPAALNVRVLANAAVATIIHAYAARENNAPTAEDIWMSFQPAQA